MYKNCSGIFGYGCVSLEASMIRGGFRFNSWVVLPQEPAAREGDWKERWIGLHAHSSTRDDEGLERGIEPLPLLYSHSTILLWVRRTKSILALQQIVDLWMPCSQGMTNPFLSLLLIERMSVDCSSATITATTTISTSMVPSLLPVWLLGLHLVYGGKTGYGNYGPDPWYVKIPLFYQ